MKKQILVGVAVLSLLVVACGSLPVLSFPTPMRVIGQHISGLTLHEGDLYFGAGYRLYRLDTQDRVLDEIMCTENWVFQRPAVDGGRAYVQVLTSPEASQFLIAVDLATDATIWRADEYGSGGPYSLRDVKDYTFLVNDRVITVRGGQTESEQRIYAFDAQSGQQVWRSELNYFHVRVIPFLIHDDLVWYAIESDQREADNVALAAIDLATGETRQTIDLQLGVRFDELLYVDDRWILGFASRKGVVFAVDRARPDEVAWYSDRQTRHIGDQGVLYDGSFIIEGDAVYALDIETGRVEWTFYPTSESALTQDFGHLVLFVFPAEGHYVLYALDAASGTMAWKYALDPYTTGPDGYRPQDSRPRPIVNGDTVYIANNDSIDALDLNTGELLWQVDVDSEYQYDYSRL